MILLFLYFLAIIWAKECVVLNEDIAVVCAFVVVFFTLRKAFYDSLNDLFKDRTSSIKVLYSHFLLIYEKLQLRHRLLRSQHVFYFFYFLHLFLPSISYPFLKLLEFQIRSVYLFYLYSIQVHFLLIWGETSEKFEFTGEIFEIRDRADNL